MLILEINQNTRSNLIKLELIYIYSYIKRFLRLLFTYTKTASEKEVYVFSQTIH